MSSTNLNMRIDVETKEKLTEVLQDYGLTVPQAFKLFANQIIKTRQIPISFDWSQPSQEHNYPQGHNYQLSPTGEAMLRESMLAFENGDYTTHSGEEALQLMREMAQ